MSSWLMAVLRLAIILPARVFLMAIEFNGSLDTLASFPMIFADPGLNTEPTLFVLIRTVVA
jgi:hypothetical protein